MRNYTKLVDNVIHEAHILLLVVDARFAEASKNKDLERKLQRLKKRFLYVYNKGDLLTFQEKKKLPHVISATQHKGTMKLLRKISSMAKGETIVGVIGYPNTGKSSLINALKGKQSAKVSNVSGYTKSLQKIRVTKNILLIDTPGVFPKKEYDDVKFALIGAKDASKLKDPETVVLKLIQFYDGKIEKHYGVTKNKDTEVTLEKIALKKRMLKKKGKADITGMAIKIIQAVQTGKV